LRIDLRPRQRCRLQRPVIKTGHKKMTDDGGTK
jgi:hypothetical protein